MKKMMMIPALVLMMNVAAFAKSTTVLVKVVSARMDVVYFKVSCEMIGSTMEVYNSEGVLLHTETVTNKKILVDFYAEPSGEYSIHLKKGNIDEVIVYNKETESHAERATGDYVLVTQE